MNTASYYEGQFKLARRRQYGASSEKSEYDFSQLSIFNEVELTADDNVLEPELAAIKKHYRKSKRLVNDNLPDNIPVEVVEHSLEPDEQICPECGENLHAIGSEKRRELVIIPAQVKIVEHVRKVYGCRNCEQDEYGQPILKTPVDNPVIKGSFVSVLYEYKPKSRKENPHRFLEGFKGYLHTDGYEAYHGLSNDITIVGCWAHVRRKFDEALKIIPENERASSDTLKGKRYCDKLFALENEFAGLPTDERHKQRQELSRPLMDEFFQWLIKLDALPKTPLGIASGYALKQRKYLESYLLDGRLEISNNRAERSIKPFVISRKNFLFANTPRGAKASAIMFSLIETAKENGLDSFKYLSYVFKNAPNWDIQNNPNYYEFILPTSLPKPVRALLV